MIRKSLIASVALVGMLMAAPVGAQTPPVAWGTGTLRQAPAWYASPEARAVAGMVARHQSPEGGWPKNTALSSPPSLEADPGLANTIDNNATTLPLAFLARVITAGDAAQKPSFDRGLDYLLAAQQPNGGWPQFYPLRGGYHDQITYNDDAMVRVLRLLSDVASGRAPYAFVDAARRDRAADAVRRGTDLILRTQVRRNGELTVWCAQHDAVTLQPAWARRFEPPSLSGSESVGIVRFLMSLDHPTPEVVAAVDGAIDWFRIAAIHDIRVEPTTTEGQPDRHVVAAPGEGPIWARFYDLESNAPIFMGRDSVAHDSLAEVERERRGGYAYYGTWPAELLAVEYPAWRTRLGLPAR